MKPVIYVLVNTAFSNMGIYLIVVFLLIH